MIGAHGADAERKKFAIEGDVTGAGSREKVSLD